MLLLAMFCCLSADMGAQRCLSAELRNNQVEHRVQAEKWQRILEDIQSGVDLISQSENVIRGTTRIPIVVHVLWRQPVQNISDAQIASQIEVINEDFRLMNQNFDQTPERFKTLADDIELEFCLANMTPSGMPTNGIVRRQVREADIGLGTNYFSTSRGGSTAWDPHRYLNIWVCELGPDLLGFATFPGMADPPESDGIVVQPQFFGRTGSASNSAPNHLGRTLTHEIGHYLGLEHLWGPTIGGCDEDDHVEDTPEQELETYDCPLFPVRDICTPQFPGIMFNNYMDYTDDECMTMFTRGQKTRMWAALSTVRPALITGSLCSSVSHADPTRTNKGIDIIENPVGDQLCFNRLLPPLTKIQIWTIDGRRLARSEVSHNSGSETCLPTHDWAPGIYIVTLSSDLEKLAFIVIKN